MSIMPSSSTALSNAQRRYLRGLAHGLKPVVIVAGKGLTENVMREIDTALNRHELIKVRLRTDRSTREAWAGSISRDSDAELVQKIGQIACFFRRNPEKPVIELPRA